MASQKSERKKAAKPEIRAETQQQIVTVKLMCGLVSGLWQETHLFIRQGQTDFTLSPKSYPQTHRAPKIWWFGR